jgi:phosphoribosyl-AMP cyclohydrolase
MRCFCSDQGLTRVFGEAYFLYAAAGNPRRTQIRPKRAIYGWKIANCNLNERDITMIELNFKKMGGLIPAVVQDYKTGEVLMLAFMNPAAWEATLATGKATYYSRTRQELWIKGKTSGNMQIIKEIRIDCDDDTVVLKVDQVGGAACHTGHKSCFYKKVEDGSVRIVGKPIFNPEEVYK